MCPPSAANKLRRWSTPRRTNVKNVSNSGTISASPGRITPRVVADVVKAKTGDVPNYLHACGYAVAQVLLEGIKKAGTTDVPAVIQALEGMSYEGPTGTEFVRPEDHQIIKDYYLMLGKAKGAMKDKNDFAEIIAGTKAFLAPDKTGCKMT